MNRDVSITTVFSRWLLSILLSISFVAVQPGSRYFAKVCLGIQAQANSKT
ncbi:hypothetical protein [Candidatus Reidiella endopervernicosa]|uniref:Uncharacterized protein n=1 Tax=Candidatus Reidiella endopervernicosa TaxID=2738883 RepID=A0A6N0HRA0_9GAMM|nr:hypothetical protein [Candidatus Reidiella endopervernicosa]QKQ24866.1 hypothetical protein HUE57_00130 [Candidatus Reidiella endopervernicosa]